LASNWLLNLLKRQFELNMSGNFSFYENLILQQYNEYNELEFIFLFEKLLLLTSLKRKLQPKVSGKSTQKYRPICQSVMITQNAYVFEDLLFQK